MVTIDGRMPRIWMMQSALPEGNSIVWSPYCGCFQLCAGKFRIRQRSPETWNQRLSVGTESYPCFPMALSNGICSLNAGEIIWLSCLMTGESKGEVTDYRLAESAIHVNRRMTYTSVARITEDQDPKRV